MKRNALASLALAFAAAFALADNLGTATKVGALSRTSDYVYTADQADAVIATRVPTTRTINGHALTGNVTVTAADIGVEAGANLGFNAISGISGEPVDVQTGRTMLVFDGSNASVSVGITGTAYPKVTISVPDGSTGSRGVVQLSSDTNSVSEAYAATPKAVKDALDGAKAYTDAHAYTHPTYTARTGKPTANAAPGFGGTFTVSQITSDGNGHVTGATDRTITIPSAVATTTAAGLMSAADKSALDSLSSGGVTKSAIAAALQAQGLSAATDTAASLDDMDTIAAKLAAVIAALDALD